MQCMALLRIVLYGEHGNLHEGNQACRAGAIGVQLIGPLLMLLMLCVWLLYVSMLLHCEAINGGTHLTCHSQASPQRTL